MPFVCRICLAGNTSLHSVKNNLLHSFYEKLTNAKFNSEDGRPRALCCFCYLKLLRCHAFTQMALRSEKTFSHLYDRGLEATHEYISEVNLNMKHHLSVATLPCVTIDGNASNAGSQVTIKVEPLPSIIMKEEVTTEPDKLLEDEPFPVNCPKNKIHFEEHVCDRDDDMEEHLSTDKSSITIKDEPLPSIDMMEEVTSEPNKLLEVESPVNCSESQITSKEDCSDQERDMEECLHKIHVDLTKSESKKKSFSCNYCNEVFNIKSKLILHIRNSHFKYKQKQFSSTEKHSDTTIKIEDKTICDKKKENACYVCDKQFNHKSTLIRHMRIHTGEKPFACDKCDKRYPQKTHLVQHKTTHTGEKPFACHVCDKQYSLKNDLVRHERTHTGEKPFACHVCEKQFYQKCTLDLHLRTHTGEKPFACHGCVKQFSQKNTLVRHMRTHTGEKPFACNECDKRYSQKAHLVQHKRTHTGEKPFACHVCDKQFTQKNYLVRHERTHTGEKPFACHLCEKQFNQKCTLVAHMRIHTGEMPFACHECDKQFKHKSTFVSHMRIHTGESQFTCNVCDKIHSKK